MNKRQLPIELAKKQESRRNETISMVQTAINELKEEGALITIPLLMKRTGLSRSTFNKPHVIETLRENKVGKFQDRVTINNGTGDSKQTRDDLYRSLEKANKKIFQLEKSLAEEKNRKLKYQELYNDQKEENAILIGVNFTLQNKLDILANTNFPEFKGK